ncbi:hypothetical protein H1R20_g2855, partial [Candolleomyces eurysporus]
MADEIDALKSRQVFELVELPKNRKTIKGRWVYDIKSDGRKRARFVAKGFSQVEGIDFEALFSPVVRYESVRFVFALAALFGWYMTAVDVKTAFLYGKLDEEIYMDQPEGFVAKGQERKVYRLHRAIYGLKQAARAWWLELEKSVRKLGFKRLHSDSGIFIYRDQEGVVIMVAYVDDIIFFGLKVLADQKKKEFMRVWECRDLGTPTEFLSMTIQYDGNTIKLDQTKYLEKVLERFGMANAKPARTPMVEGYYPAKYEGPNNAVLTRKYQSVIGSLLYLMLGTRPDIAYAVTKMAQHCANPTEEHLSKALYIMKYLVGTRKYSLVFEGRKGLGQGLESYTDSDYAQDPTHRLSQTGNLVLLASGAVSWKSYTQKSIATSSTEAEYMALSDCAKQVIWLRILLKELGIPMQVPVPIYVDNQGAIFNASNPVQEHRTKHIDVRYHLIRQYVENEDVSLFYIPTDDNPADIFTKPLGRVKFELFRKSLGLVFH